MTPQQLATLKADILADPLLAGQPMNSDGAQAIADAYQVLAEPAFWVWRTSVPKHELTDQPSRTGTNFVWAGNGFITRSEGERACWAELFNTRLACNPSLPNVRQAFADIFSGTTNAAANRAHLDIVCRRRATRGERLFATGQGQDNAANAGLLVVEGQFSIEDIQKARALE